jgi:head-tail adaptor
VIRAGSMDRRIRVEASTQAKDPRTREMVATWPPAGGVLLGILWAEPLPAVGREFFAAKQRVAEVSAGWRVHWQHAIADELTPSERFRVVDEAGRAYDVVEVLEEGRRETLLIFGKARAE